MKREITEIVNRSTNVSFFILSYTEKEVKEKGYSYGVFEIPNPKDISFFSKELLFQSNNFNECELFCSTERKRQYIFIDAEGNSEIISFNDAILTVRMWRKGIVEFCEFINSSEKKMPLYIYGKLFGSINKIESENKQKLNPKILVLVK